MSRRRFARVNRRAQRKDATHDAVVAAFRARGCTVDPGECWDLWLYIPNAVQPVVAIEVKNGELSASKRRLTPREVGFARRWPGPGAIVGGAGEVGPVVVRARVGALCHCAYVADRYRDETEPGWRQREAVALADEVLG